MTDRLTAADFPVSAERRAGILADLTAEMDADSQHSEVPRLTFVTGQPAAGKSRTIDRISAEFDSAPVVLDSDVIRLNHPMMDEIIATDPQRMDVLSNGPVGEWMGGLIDHARESGYNVIIENTLTNPTQVTATAEAFHQAGYQVNVAALAVPAEDSRLGIVQRYIAGLDNDPYPRWTTESSHSSAYTGMVEGLQQVTGVVDSIEVYTRSGEALYSGSDGVAAAAAVTEHRGLPKDASQVDSWTSGYLGVVDRIAEPGMITNQTRTVIGNLLADAERIVESTELPEVHSRLHAVVVEDSPYRLVDVEIPDPYDFADPYSVDSVSPPADSLPSWLQEGPQHDQDASQRGVDPGHSPEPD
ncbi:zeta toxin family protein [Corynebacterium sp. AOP40-9SA-29]|uniref:zeta toxin family protein n=1 Tax=Corynebacterium sp. AOP40-9SA-29 TaxID=3457677 RepID=UPI00403393D9